MDIYDLIATRQSDRKYDPNRRPERSVINRILEAARLAPSACNAQPWHFVVVDNPQKCNAIAQCLTSALTGSMNAFAAQAPVHILVVEEKPNLASRIGGIIKQRHFPHIDIGMAVQNLVLAATHEGLGSCIIGWLDEKKIQRLLGIPSSKPVLLDIALGYSLEEPKNKVRKPLTAISSYNQYNK